MLINSWKGFFSMGSSFFGFVIGFMGVFISFFITTLEAELPEVISFSMIYNFF